MPRNRPFLMRLHTLHKFRYQNSTIIMDDSIYYYFFACKFTTNKLNLSDIPDS